MNFKYKKKEKEKIDKAPKKKEIQTKGVKRVVLGGLVVVLLSGVGAYVKATAVSDHVSKVESSVKLLKNDVEGDNEKKLLLTPELQSFMDRFVSEYVNIPNDDEQFKKRSETLVKEYYAKGMNEDTTSFSAKRSLKDYTLVSLKYVDGVPVASYQVSYEIENPVTKTVEEKHKDSKGKMVTSKKEITATEKSVSEQVLNIPFIEKNQSFCINAYPYFTEPVTTKANENVLSYDDEKMGKVDLKTEKEVEKFVEEFMTKYCESSSADMAYMMNDPEGLNGNFSLDQVDSKIYKSNDSVVVKVDVSLKDKDTSILQKEQLTLELVKKSDKYYVQKLSHTWKESE